MNKLIQIFISFTAAILVVIENIIHVLIWTCTSENIKVSGLSFATAVVVSIFQNGIWTSTLKRVAKVKKGANNKFMMFSLKIFKKNK
jgi:hypothetical protein